MEEEEGQLLHESIQEDELKEIKDEVKDDDGYQIFIFVKTMT